MDIELISRPAEGKKLGTLLFVHGVCHGAWCWENYADFFTAQGFDTHALSLRGHGKSDGGADIHRWGLSDYINDVLGAIDRIGEPPIVVGHSMGAAVVQKLIGEHHERVNGAVLLAPAVEGGLRLDWKARTLLRCPTKALGMLAFLIRPPTSPASIRQSIFFHGRITEAEAARVAPHFCKESRRARLDLARPFSPYKPPPAFPVMVIGAQEDLIFSAYDTKKTAAAYGVEPILLADMCHDMMLDPDWDIGAKEILAFVKGVVDARGLTLA